MPRYPREPRNRSHAAFGYTSPGVDRGRHYAERRREIGDTKFFAEARSGCLGTGHRSLSCGRIGAFGPLLAKLQLTSWRRLCRAGVDRRACFLVPMFVFSYATVGRGRH
jgi:hypothetical protein